MRIHSSSASPDAVGVLFDSKEDDEEGDGAVEALDVELVLELIETIETAGVGAGSFVGIVVLTHGGEAAFIAASS